jgi:hypothetical protein
MDVKQGLEMRKSISQNKVDITDYYSVDGKKESWKMRKPNFMERMQDEKNTHGLVSNIKTLPPLEAYEMQISTNVREVMRRKREKSAPQARNKSPIGETYPGKDQAQNTQ